MNVVFERLIGLAERALAEAPSSKLRDQLIKMRIDVEASKAAYQNAKLLCEVAEIAVIEYKEGIFVQDLVTVEGEIKLAESNRFRTRDVIDFAKDRLARISARSDKTAMDLNIEYNYSDKVVAAERDASKSQAALERLEAKKKLLVEYTKPRRLKELQSEVEKLRSQELAKQAEWESRKAQEARLEKMIRRSDPDIGTKRILALIKCAIPIEEQARAKLERLEKDEKADESLLKEVQDQTNELSAILDEGEAVWSAGELAGLKSRLEEVARRLGGAAK